jgi:hypothetical protein
VIAAPSTRPSDRRCLLAWNASTNGANQRKLVAARPAAVSLLPGTAGTDTWTGASTASTASSACLLAVSTPGRIRIVVGTWRAGHVRRWSFGPPIPTTKPFFANVRLLSDGRVSKISR